MNVTTTGNSMTPGKDVWRVERADRMSIIVDAEDYFRIAREAMMGARKRIMLIGWDFDARIALDRSDEVLPGPVSVGDYIYWLVERNPELEVYLLRWGMGAIKSLFRGKTIFTVMKWMKHPRIHTKLDNHHPTGASHHQKIVVIDDNLAFCGGIDMTGDRWDTRAHRDDDPKRVFPNGGPYKPWHDATSAVQGAAAVALGDLSRERWRRASGKAIPPVKDIEDRWPESLPVDFEKVDIGIARTFPKMEDQEGVHESEALFLAQIAAAREHLYIESQYFASRKIAEAIARRLDQPDCPDIVIINPHTAQGWLEPIAMDTARARLMEALHRRDTRGRLRMYHPETAGGEEIYVHAKILIADDTVLRLGSSNMNNRSLRLDTECDVTLTANDEAMRDRVATIRNELIAEHLGVDADAVTASIAQTGSLIATIEAMRVAPKSGAKTLVPYEEPDLTAIEEWLADNEVLDPEGPDEMFEGFAKRGLFRRLRSPK